MRSDEREFMDSPEEIAKNYLELEFVKPVNGYQSIDGRICESKEQAIIRSASLIIIKSLKVILNNVYRYAENDDEPCPLSPTDESYIEKQIEEFIRTLHTRRHKEAIRIILGLEYPS